MTDKKQEEKDTKEISEFYKFLGIDPEKAAEELKTNDERYEKVKLKRAGLIKPEKEGK